MSSCSTLSLKTALESSKLQLTAHQLTLCNTEHTKYAVICGLAVYTCVFLSQLVAGMACCIQEGQQAAVKAMIAVIPWDVPS